MSFYCESRLLNQSHFANSRQGNTQLRRCSLHTNIEVSQNFLDSQGKSGGRTFNRTILVEFTRLDFNKEQGVYNETKLYSQEYVNGKKVLIHKPRCFGLEQPKRDPKQMIYTAQAIYRFTVIETNEYTIFWDMSPSQVFEKVDQFNVNQEKKPNCVTFTLQPTHPKHPILARFY